mgnify:CR=1 FL=1
MLSAPVSRATPAASLLLAPNAPPAAAILAAAGHLLPHLEQGSRIDAAILRALALVRDQGLAVEIVSYRAPSPSLRALVAAFDGGA